MKPDSASAFGEGRQARIAIIFAMPFLMLLFLNCGGNPNSSGFSSNREAETPASDSQAPPAGSTPVSGQAVIAGVAANFVLSPYKDVGINLNWNTYVISTAVTGSLKPLLQTMPGGLDVMTLAFATGECGAENWAGLAPDALVNANLANFAAAGKSYIVSTGGAAGAFTCSTDSGFDAFIRRYLTAGLIGIDFDIEGAQTQAQIDSLVLRVIKAQKTYPSLRFSFTLATLAPSLGANVAVDSSASSPDPLGFAGQMVMKAIKKFGLQNYFINLMVMDYGSPAASVCVVDGARCEMGQSAVQAAMDLHGFYGLPYRQIELTPMIGANDIAGEVFTLADVQIMSRFVKASGIAGVHHWSWDRDNDCASAYASPTCNSYNRAGTLGFLNAFLEALK